MQLNAKAFCLIALVLLCATGGWCVYQINTPLEPIKDGTGKLPDAPEPWTIGILDFVTDQLVGNDLSVPITPFGWSKEGLLGKTIQDLINERNAPRGQGGPGGVNVAGRIPGGPGGNNRPGGPGAGAADTGPKMITPKITFNGFMKRSDGSRVAMFSDSSDKSTIFYEPGKKVHGIEILGADMKEAQIRYADGTEATITIGGSIELPEELEKSGATPQAQG